MARLQRNGSIPYEWGKICEAIGVEPHLVRDISINLPADGPAVFEVELYATTKMLRIIWPIPSSGDNGDEGP